MKKMLVYAHYYYPDVASTGQILTELCDGLKDNFDITVICTIPSYTGKIDNKYKEKKYYEENINGVKVIRVRVPEFIKTSKISRIKNILSYYINAIKVTKKLGFFDIVYTISQPPILGGMLGLKGKKITKGKLIYNIQDFNPEQILAVNYSKNKLITKLMMHFDMKTCNNSDLIITVGHDMQDTLKNRFNNKNVPNNIVINNWIDEKEIYPLDKANEGVSKFLTKYNLENKFIIMYSGNIGLYYDLENIVKIFSKYRDRDDLAFVFIGDGGVKDTLIDFTNKNSIKNIYFIPYQDKKDLIYSLNAADVHLVTNSKGIKGISVPSKIYGVMATNKPIFGILEEGSEAFNIINASNCGIVAKAGDYEDIDKKIYEIINEKEKFVNKHLTGREYLVNNFTKYGSIDKYKNEIEKLVM